MEGVPDIRLSDKNIMDKQESYRFLYACGREYVRNKEPVYSKLEPVWNKDRKWSKINMDLTMYKANFVKNLTTIVSLFFLTVVLVTSSYSKEIYKWVDKDGTIHFTDDPAQIPQENRKEAETIQGNEEDPVDEVDVDLIAPQFEEEGSELYLEQQRQREEAQRDYWRSLALQIETREKAILEQIEITKEEIKYKRREVDYLLLNGYFADHSVLELRYLENLLNGLKNQLALIDLEKENLKTEARRQGIPPGYLRP